MNDPRSRIPGLDRLLLDEGARAFLAQFPRPRVADALRAAVASAREALARDEWPHDPADPSPYLDEAGRRLEAESRPSLRGVINATGVVLHTNLGRAPLAVEARVAMARAAEGYSNLEFDLDAGGRGSRYEHCRDLLRECTGAEDAVVVNNCAAALVVVVNALAAGRGVVVSRGELVEIGGGFRIPEMLTRAGAALLEVGSTNRTRLRDYRAAFEGGVEVGAILKVHRSNFRIRGFTESVEIEALATLASERGVPLVHDVGSGLLVEPATLGLPDEPTPARSLARGAGLAVFSGDKLLGGPQAGVVVGRSHLVERVRRNPLCRAMRVDKATLAALEATLRLYREPETVRDRVPVLRMLTRSADELEGAAEDLATRLRLLPGIGPVSVEASVGRVGGGTFPDHELPAWVVRLTPAAGGVDALAARLRTGVRPVVARVENGALLLDPRTVGPDEVDALVGAVGEALDGAGQG
ncbi:L-seryl-tRNA(Sec) selenium transferase [Gemmatimonadota bacterium Y43]|uniref:L-seryl-tRNA(Sec) selenium transferase n=1 Tax=Gaopeijia maritima TaxID=3119007 RepID=UPI00326CB5B3